MAGLAWAWTGIAGACSAARSASRRLAGGERRRLGDSGPTAIDQVLAPMLTPTAIAVGLTWIGGAVLLGVLLDVASPAGAAVGGLIWSGAIVALLGAAGDGAAPTPLLAPALIVAVAWAIWDRADRPDLRPRAAGAAPESHPAARPEPSRDRCRGGARAAPGAADRPPAPQSGGLAARRRAHPGDADGDKTRAGGTPWRRFASRVALGLTPISGTRRVCPGPSERTSA